MHHFYWCVCTCIHVRACMHACSLLLNCFLTLEKYSLFQRCSTKQDLSKELNTMSSLFMDKDYYSCQAIVDERQGNNFMDIGIIIDKLSRHHNAHAWLRYNYVNNKIIIIIILYITVIINIIIII